MKSKNLKKLLIALCAIIFVILIIFIITYSQNGKLRKNVSKGVIKESDLPSFSFIFPTIYHYNKGNVYYYLGDYDLAYAEYTKSLRRGMKGDKDCKLRINAALALVAPLDLEYITEDDIPDLLETFYTARDLLLLKGCANEDGYSGHDANAQILENEIQAWIDFLENPEYSDPDDQNNNDSNGGPGGDGDDQNQDNGGDQNQDNGGDQDQNGNDQNNDGSGNQDGDNPDGDEPLTDEEIERKLSELTKQGNSERNTDMEYWSGSSEYGYDFSTDRGSYW